MFICDLCVRAEYSCINDGISSVVVAAVLLGRPAVLREPSTQLYLCRVTIKDYFMTYVAHLQLLVSLFTRDSRFRCIVVDAAGLAPHGLRPLAARKIFNALPLHHVCPVGSLPVCASACLHSLARVFTQVG